MVRFTITATCCCCYLVTQSCPTLCNPMNYNPANSSVHWISRTRILEWVAIPSSRGSFLLHWIFPPPLDLSDPGIESGSPTLVGRRVLYHGATRDHYAAAASLQSLCNPIHGSPPGSPIPGIFQARVLEWGAIAFSRDHYTPL